MQLTAEQEVTALQQRYLGAINDELRQGVPPRRAASQDDVHTLLRYHLGWEEADGAPSKAGAGKGLRPVLCLMACEMTSGDWRPALPAAVSLELIHNFSLIHDDIQDKDITRRGRATAWSIWGVPKALTAGNAMRVLADQSLLRLADLGLSPDCTTAAAQMLTTRYMEMIEGQYLDMSFEQSYTVTTDDYMDMIGRKTGALVESAMFLGALVGSCDSQAAQGFGACGRLLGLAFQVQDDYLGIWGDPAKLGKPVGSDIWRKKKSLPVLHVFQNAQGKDREELRRIYSAPQVGGEDVEAVMSMMDSMGTAAFVQETAKAHAQIALEPLQSLDLPPQTLRQVQAMAEFFVTRER